MSKTREEVAQEASEDAVKAAEAFRDEQKSAAEKEREDAPDAAETEEEYYARVKASSASGIFGDLETSTDQPVVSSNNEAATAAVAEKDAAGIDASDDEARRQVDINAGTTASAEEVTENAPEDNSADADKEDKRTPAQKAADKRKNAS